MIMLKNYDIGYIIEVRWYKVIKLVICLDVYCILLFVWYNWICKLFCFIVVWYEMRLMWFDIGECRIVF